MTEFSLLSAQVRAARSLLNWSQSYLADGCMVSRSTIADLEANKRQPHESSLYIIMSELNAAGIEFTERGVEFTEIPPKEYVPTGIRQKNSQGN
ncbi:helix-turn-helix transcriptional regulator [Paenochrobactrum sp. BZR 588]|uniref:helix-turn-helix transcriptional regulator n=1 Tax=unclassified Paenochrobactrum TaxID=2639760 RepID=UPI0038553085